MDGLKRSTSRPSTARAGPPAKARVSTQKKPSLKKEIVIVVSFEDAKRIY
jgi:hypothetical protein